MIVYGKLHVVNPVKHYSGAGSVNGERYVADICIDFLLRPPADRAN